MPEHNGAANRLSIRKQATEEDQKLFDKLQRDTDALYESRERYLALANERRDTMLALRDRGWSYRRIGETIGISGQRVDSIIKQGPKEELT